MTPKEKAIELVLRYSKINTRHKDSIKCVLIAVDEIINCDSFFQTFDEVKSFAKYWYEVQDEINKL